MTKQIYLLRPTSTGPSMVVRAACVTCARSAAAAGAGVEGTAYWRDPERTTCDRVREEGISGTVLRREA